MDSQQPRREGNRDYSDRALHSPADFDRWASAVRKQMLNCLNRRSKPSAD